MEQVNRKVLYLVIGLLFVIVTWILIRSNNRKLPVKPIEKADPITIETTETGREAIKRDFNDLESLITEIKNS